jgi:hypothetical protein
MRLQYQQDLRLSIGSSRKQHAMHPGTERWEKPIISVAWENLASPVRGNWIDLNLRVPI